MINFDHDLLTWPLFDAARLNNGFRRQFLSCGNWRRAIANSNLPQSVQETITELVIQTKLMRFEKSEIADEIIAHFQDGHTKGKTFEELTAVFGDPAVAAALFRSSKLRSRPMAIKASKLTLWVTLASGIGYFLLMAYFNLSSPDPSVDYLEPLNTRAEAVPTDERAWPIYRPAFAKYKFCDGGWGGYEEIFVKDDKGNATRDLVRPTDANWDAVIAQLRASQDLIDALREGSRHDYVGLALQIDKSAYSKEDFQSLFPNVEYAYEEAAQQQREEWDAIAHAGCSVTANRLMNMGLVSVLLPHTQSFCTATAILRVDTRQAIMEQEPERAVDNIRAMLGFARQQKNESILVCQLVGMAIAKTAVAQVQEILTESPDAFTDAQLEQLQNLIGEIDWSDTDLSMERQLVRDVLQRVYSDDGNGDGHLTPVGLEVLAMFYQLTSGHGGPETKKMPWHQRSSVGRSLAGPALMVTAPGRRETAFQFQDVFDEVEARFSNPWWEDDFSDIEIKDELNDAFRLLPSVSWDHLHNAAQNTIAVQDSGILGVAIHRYHRKFNSWPETLEQMQGNVLDKLPLDRIHGQPLLFNASDQGVIVYSVGRDRDEDGGHHHDKAWPLYAGERPREAPQTVDGDWVMWPSDRD